MIRIEVESHGPLFAGEQVPAAIEQYHGHLKRQVATQVLADVHYVLDRRIVHPTPYYETQIQMVQFGVRDWSVNDRGVIYGPWLEGVSSRNDATRFKGYHAFREAMQESSQYIPVMAGQLWAQYAGRVN